MEQMGTTGGIRFFSVPLYYNKAVYMKRTDGWI